MQKISEIKVCGKKVVVRELTVTQVARQFDGIEGQDVPTTLDWMFAEDYMPQNVLEEIISTKVETLVDDDTAPSDLEPLYKEALRINPFLEKALKQMRRIGTLMEGLEIETGVPVKRTGLQPPPST